MSSQAFVAGLLTGFNRAIEPLGDALGSPVSLEAFLAEFGWTLTPGSTADQIVGAFGQLPTALSDVSRAADALAKLSTSGGSGDALLSAISDAGTAIRSLTAALHGLSMPANASTLPFPLSEPAFWSTFPVQVLDLLIYRALEHDVPKLFGILHVLGVLSEQPGAPANGQSAFVARTVNWKQLSVVVSNPTSLMHDVYGWGTSGFDAVPLLRNFERVLTGFKVPAVLADPDPSELDLYYDPAAPTRKGVVLLRAPLYWGILELGDALDYLEVRLAILPIPPPGSRSMNPDGLAVFLDVLGSLQTPSIALTTGLALNLSGGFESVGALRAEVHPGSASASIQAILPTPITAEARLNANSATEPWVLFGAKGSTRLELAAAHASLQLHGDQASTELVIQLAADTAALVIDFSEGDGFLSHIFGDRPQRVEFAVVAEWSSRSGLRFGGSATPEIAVPLHVSLAGAVSATKLVLAARPGPQSGSARLEISVDGGLQLGPMAATVSGVGLALEVRTVGPGNLGALDLSFGFKPPHGVGLAIDASVIVGGGFLLFDANAEQYAGAIQLELAKTLSLTAFGLLTTRMPDGSRGFSLLVLIDAEFTPAVQLGFGFTLDGVGGLLGVNRTVGVEVLRKGLRAGTLGSIMFPADPIRNAPGIVSDLQAVFPPADGRFLIGPMLKLGWGTPRLLTIELGVILELPAPVRLLILGRLRVLLPEETHPVVRLQLDALGVVDFSSGDLALDAVLYDSEVATFAVTGAMALRANWGSKPGFVLAVGGFNPRFPVPGGFPSIDRLSISLATGDNPRLRLEAYLALTTNTVQFGSRLDLSAHAGPFSLEGYLAFDVLIQLEPFGFIAQLGAAIALKYNGRSILSISLDMTLAAPAPWHAWGKARFHILFISGHISFDVRFGQPHPPPLPPATSVRPRLLEALRNPDNWTTQAVAVDHPLVSLRARPGATDRLVHPLADLRVLQRVVPLERDIDRFGSAVPVERHFSLTVLAPPIASSAVESVEDFFAPAEFRQMTEDEKITAPAFERQPAGLRFGSRNYATGGSVVETQIDYITRTIYSAPPASAAASAQVAALKPAIPARLEPTVVRVRRVGPGFMDQVASVGAAGRAPLAAVTLAPGVSSRVTLKESAFVVVVGRGVETHAAARTPLDYMTARQILHERMNADPAERRRVRIIPTPMGR